MKKYWKAVLITVIVVLLLITPLFLFGALGTFSVVHAKLVYSINPEQFEIVADRVLEQGSATGIKPPNGVKDIDIYRTHSGCVDFYMGGFGLVPSSTYWGVIYTVEDTPVGWGGLDVNYTWDGEGWCWQEKNGDNVSYVIKLKDHWYLYRTSF